jgi:nucleoside-diphosphate-sugar epimerase
MSLVAVTGASGFIGRRLMFEVEARGHEVLGFVRRSTKKPIGRVIEIDDLNNLAEPLRGVEVVIHCAARVHVMHEHAKNSSSLYHAVNVEGTRQLAESAARSGVRRLIFLSSVKAVAERSSLNRSIQLSDRPCPEDDYGRSKREAELVLQRVAAATGLEIVIVRPPLVYGPGVKGNFWRLMSLVARGIPLPLGALNNSRSLVSLPNLADFLCRCLDAPAAVGETFFVSDGEDLSTSELIRRLSFALNRPACLLPVPTSILNLLGRWVGKSVEVERLVGNLQVDITRNRELLGWSPPLSVDASLQETADWFLSR